MCPITPTSFCWLTLYTNVKAIRMLYLFHITSYTPHTHQSKCVILLCQNKVYFVRSKQTNGTYKWCTSKSCVIGS